MVRGDSGCLLFASAWSKCAGTRRTNAIGPNKWADEGNFRAIVAQSTCKQRKFIDCTAEFIFTDRFCEKYCFREWESPRTGVESFIRVYDVHSVSLLFVNECDDIMFSLVGVCFRFLWFHCDFCVFMGGITQSDVSSFIPEQFIKKLYWAIRAFKGTQKYKYNKWTVLNFQNKENFIQATSNRRRSLILTGFTSVTVCDSALWLSHSGLAFACVYHSFSFWFGLSSVDVGFHHLFRVRKCLFLHSVRIKASSVLHHHYFSAIISYNSPKNREHRYTSLQSDTNTLT